MTYLYFLPITILWLVWLGLVIWDYKTDKFNSGAFNSFVVFNITTIISVSVVLTFIGIYKLIN